MKRATAGRLDLPAPTNIARLAELLLTLFPADQFSADHPWITKFSQAFEIREMQLGDELMSNPPGGFGIVCQGRVRLVSFDAAQQREVPAVLLEAGESWGMDDRFCDRPFPYRAVAASAGTIAVMPAERLESWLQRFSTLSDHLHRVIQARQQLIFFKIATELRSQPSHILKILLPYLNEIQIPAGARLTERAGCSWLRSGQISGSDSPDALPQIGDRWEAAVSENWVAATPLSLYQLTAYSEEVAQILAPNPAIQRSGRLVQPLSLPPPAPPVPDRPTPSAPDAIDFAKPIRAKRWWGQSYPFISQQSGSDCGAACLAMIAQYWGKRFSLNMLRDLAGVGRSGASLKGLSQAAESIGFQARPVRSSFNRLAEQPLPWVAHWQGDHYIVVYCVKRSRVVVADPALGRRSLSIAEFQAGWTGYALLLNPTEMLQSMPSARPSLGRFMGAFLPYRSLLWSIVFASALLQVFGLVTPLFTQIILDQVVVHKSLPTLHVFALGLLLFGFWRIGLVSVRQYLLDYLSNQVDLTLISGFISHTLNLPLKFFATRHVGDIVTRVQENQKIQVFLTRQAVAAWLDATMALVYVGLMLHYNRHLALLVLALLPPIVLVTVIASPFLRRISRQVFHESAQQNSTLVEMLTGVATVKATAAERELRWQWEDQLTGFFNAQFRGQKLANGLQALGGAINTLGSTALLWYGAMLVIQDQLSIGQFVAFNMMIGNVIGPVLSLVGLWDEFQEVLVSVERLDDIFSAQTEENLDQPLLRLSQVRGEVKFETVTFRYNADDDRNILQNISFEVKPGKTIAIVGRSGSGKTTLISLLQGLYQPITGRVTIDGNDLKHVSPQSFRHQLGVVPQECFLFSGTILDNITLYRSEYSLDQVLEVSKLAEAHAFIQGLPLGYHTKVGERGTMLSGGQRQRIAIARALLSNPRILILDEATSSLDTESERRFQKNLQHISRDRTTFIIAHRLSTVRNADCILVLDRGIVVEQGTHEQLMVKQGLYAQLTQQQLDI